MISRRTLLRGLAAFAAGSVGLAGYAFGIEPMWRLGVQRYKVRPRRWPKDLPLSIAVIADLHACEPYMPLRRIEEIVRVTNRLKADVIVLLGDFTAGHRYTTGQVASEVWAGALAGLKAPLGVHAILGNHDWWDDRMAQRLRHGPIVARRALEKAGIPVYENDVVRIAHRQGNFWLAGLADQLAIVEGRGRFRGIHDLPGTLAKVTDEAPVILLAHEPDIFPQVPGRVSLTLSGHTHGGQVRIFGWSPIVPSSYANRYAYGHIVEDGRELIVSGGLGCSIIPVRFGVPPEIVLVSIG